MNDNFDAEPMRRTTEGFNNQPVNRVEVWNLDHTDVKIFESNQDEYATLTEADFIKKWKSEHKMPSVEIDMDLPTITEVAKMVIEKIKSCENFKSIIEFQEYCNQELRHAAPTIEKKCMINPDERLLWNFIRNKYGRQSVKEVTSRDPLIYIREYAQYYQRKYTKIFTGEGTDPVIPKSLVFGLFEKYGDQFAGETEDYWFDRWLNEPGKLDPIRIEPRYRKDNNFHLILTILAEAFKIRLNIPVFEKYICDRWGIDKFSKKQTLYVVNSKNPAVRPHRSAKEIRDLIINLAQ